MAGGGVVLILSALVARNGWLMNRSSSEPWTRRPTAADSDMEDMQSQSCLEIHLYLSEQDDRNGYVSKCGLHVGKTTLIDHRGHGNRVFTVGLADPPPHRWPFHAGNVSLLP